MPTMTWLVPRKIPKVDAYIHGIGENKAVRDLYVQRAEDAWNALEAK